MTTRKRPTEPTTAAAVDSGAGSARPRYLLTAAQSGVQIHVVPSAGTVLLGRGPDCHVLLDHPSISRQHARLEIGETCTLTDLRSRNGTLLRGQRLAPDQAYPLGLEDSFALGSVSVLLIPPDAKPAIAVSAVSRLRIEDPTAEDSSGLLTAVAQAAASGCTSSRGARAHSSPSTAPR